jgi:hypothetical protein
MGFKNCSKANLFHIIDKFSEHNSYLLIVSY